MTNETIVAVYDTEADAEHAVRDLLAAQVADSAISRHSSEGTWRPGDTAVGARPVEEKGFWATLFGGETEDDHRIYEHSVAAGGHVVTVAVEAEHDHDAITAILERHNPVDLEERGAGYGLASTETVAPGISPAQMSQPTAVASGFATDAPLGATHGGTLPLRAAGASEGTLHLSEESLSVGKRLINRGGTRIRRYVVETPVEQSVNLRSEKVTLDRRPVTDGRPVTDADFAEKTIEMTETAEEAVVSKTARVVEEVSLRKQASDRVEKVSDTVRRDEVAIEQLPGAPATKPGVPPTAYDVSGPKI